MPIKALCERMTAMLVSAQAVIASPAYKAGPQISVMRILH
jgi:hypothetical protein